MTTLTIPPEARAYSVSLEVRDVEATGRRFIEGRAVPYETWGSVGWFMEKHAQDSFKQSVTGGTGKRAPLLLFHDNRLVPHRSRRAVACPRRRPLRRVAPERLHGGGPGRRCRGPPVTS